MQKRAELRIQAVVEDQADHALAEASIVEIELSVTNGQPLRYQFAKPTAEATYYYLERSDFPYRFKVAEFDVKPLLEATAEALVDAPAGEQTAPDREVSEAEGALLQNDPGI